jgi:hypothetical protein
MTNKKIRLRNQKQLTWLDEHNINYSILSTVIHPQTYEPFTNLIELKNEKDLIMFKLRWSE